MVLVSQIKRLITFAKKNLQNIDILNENAVAKLVRLYVVFSITVLKPGFLPMG